MASATESRQTELAAKQQKLQELKQKLSRLKELRALRDTAMTQQGQTPPPPAPQAATPSQLPPLTGADIIPQPGPQAPEPPQSPGLITQAGALVKGLPGFQQMRQGAQTAMENVPGLQRLQGLVDKAPLIDLAGGERGLTIGGAEGAGRVGGALLGGALAGPPGAAVGQALGGAAGAGIGTWLDRLARGEKVTAGDVAFEAGASMVPDILLAGGKQAIKGGKRLLSRTSGGIRESENLAAKHLRSSPDDLIKPPSKVENDQLWSIVHASGDRLNPNSLRGAFSKMTDAQWNIVMQKVRRIPAPPNSRIDDFGEAAERVMARIRDGKQTVQPLALGELQHLRSQVQKAKLSLEDSANRDSLQIFQDAIDDAMLNPKSYTSGAGDVGVLLKAREGFRKIKETEEVAELMWNVTSKSPKNDRLTVNLGRLSDALEHPKAGMQQRAVDALRRQPGAIAELQTFLKNMEKIDITPGALAGITGGLGQGIALVGAAGAAVAGREESGVGTGAVLLLANILAGPAARAQFNAIVLRNEARTGARTIALPMLATLANMARRETMGQQP